MEPLPSIPHHPTGVEGTLHYASNSPDVCMDGRYDREMSRFVDGVCCWCLNLMVWLGHDAWEAWLRLHGTAYID